eukprot:3704717-Pleurochrysis_carterae.AAC.1
MSKHADDCVRTQKSAGGACSKRLRLLTLKIESFRSCSPDETPPRVSCQPARLVLCPLAERAGGAKAEPEHRARRRQLDRRLRQLARSQQRLRKLDVREGD